MYQYQQVGFLFYYQNIFSKSSRILSKVKIKNVAPNCDQKSWYDKLCKEKRNQFNMARLSYNRVKSGANNNTMNIKAKEYRKTLNTSYPSKTSFSVIIPFNISLYIGSLQNSSILISLSSSSQKFKFLKYSKNVSISAGGVSFLLLSLLRFLRMLLRTVIRNRGMINYEKKNEISLIWQDSHIIE
jgi:hypothetical protein